MRDQDQTPRNPRSDKLALDSLGGHPGWPLYCDRFNLILQKDIEARIFDPKTSDEECRTLRAARKMLVDSYSPDKMRESMLTALRTEITRQDSQVR